MLSDESFGAGMTVLESRFGPVVKQELGRASDVVKRFYRQTIEKQLDDELFTLAVEGVIASSRFFPTPQEIIEAGLGTPREIALKEWNELVQYRQERRQKLSFPISPAGEYAARSVGGIRFVCDSMNELSRSTVRKDFIESYVLALKMGLSAEATPVKVMTGGAEAEPPEIDFAGRDRLRAMVDELVHHPGPQLTDNRESA